VHKAPKPVRATVVAVLRVRILQAARWHEPCIDNLQTADSAGTP